MEKERFDERASEEENRNPDGNADLLLRYSDPLAHAEEYQPAAFPCGKPGNAGRGAKD